MIKLFCASESECMLESVCELLPIWGTEQDLLTACYAMFHPELERMQDQLKIKLAKTMFPTGNPNKPRTIR